MKPGVFHILRVSRGQAIVETALALPILVVLVLGVFEFGRALQANSIVVNMGRETANLASRTTSAPQDIMDAVGNTAQPLDMTKHGMIYITKVQGQPNGDVVVVNTSDQVKWSNGGYTPPGGSRIGTPNKTNYVTTIAKGTLRNGTTAYVAEVFYDYQVTFPSLKLKPTLYSMTLF